jgi:hypothetical protein
LIALVGGLFAGIPLVGIFSLILKFSHKFWGYHQWEDGIKHFPPVGLTSQWSPCSMGQLLRCTWVLQLLTQQLNCSCLNYVYCDPPTAKPFCL